MANQGGIAGQAGMPDYATQNLYTEFWSSKTIEHFYANTFLTQISNTDYEGEIKDEGSEVHIVLPATVELEDYERGGLKIQNLSPSLLTLPINRAHSYAYNVNLVDKKQMKKNYIDNATNDASQNMKIKIERNVLGSIYADASVNNQGKNAGIESGELDFGTVASPRQFTVANSTQILTEINQGFDEQNANPSGRYVMLPAWACRRLKNSDIKSANVTGDSTGVIRNGLVGSIDGLDIYNTNLLAKEAGTSTTHIIAGHKSALTFASQLVHNEIVDNPTDFGKIHRGLQVYGFKVIKGEALAHLVLSA